MATLEQAYLNRLYDLMDKAKKLGEADDAATLRWAIFTLVQYLHEQGIKIEL